MYAQRENWKDAGAIVVVGYSPPDWVISHAQGTLLPYVHPLCRVLSAVSIARETQLPILLSGGKTTARSPSEARQMQQILRQHGVNPKWLEEKSLTTWGNGQYSSKILHENGINKIWICTHPWHFSRVRYVFDQFGIESRLHFEPYMATSKHSIELAQSSPTIGLWPALALLNAKEYIAKLVYKALTGYRMRSKSKKNDTL